MPDGGRIIATIESFDNEAAVQLLKDAKTGDDVTSGDESVDAGTSEG